MSLRYLISVISWTLCPVRVGSFRPLKSLFLVNRTITVFCGLIDSWVLEHHCCTILKTSWRSSWTAFQNFPVISISLSTQYPIVRQPFSLSSSVSSSTTMLHSSGDKTPPCREPLATCPSGVSPTSVAVIFCCPAWSWSSDRLCLQARAIWQLLLWCCMRCCHQLPECPRRLKCHLIVFHCFFNIWNYIVECSFSCLPWMVGKLILM